MQELYKTTIAMLKIWTQEVLNEWINVFSNLLSFLPAETLKKDAFDLASGLGDMSQPLASRVVSA